MPDLRTDITVVPEPSEKRLNKSQLQVYRSHRETFINWLETKGHPTKDGGYAHHTTHRTAYDIDRFYRWVWTNYGGFTTSITTDHGNRWLGKISEEDCSDTHKANRLKSLKRYYRWRDLDFDPIITFTGDQSQTSVKDYFTRQERTLLREASLKLDSVPDYNSLSRNEREEWKQILSARLRVPKSEIGRDEFERANSYKRPTIVYTSLDAGLRPIEVGRARVNWVDFNNKRLIIPSEQASKGDDNWVIPLRDDTVELLRGWFKERQQYDIYDDSDRIWLTREGEPLSSRTLNYLLDKLIEEAGIDAVNRDLTWYSIRHSTGTYLAQDGDLKSAAQILRHKQIETTSRYNQTPEDELRKKVNNLEDQ